MKLLPLSLAMLIVSAPVLADDGQRLVRSVSSPPGISEEPEPEGEHAFVSLMNFYVPSQAANGEIVPIEYYNIDDLLVKTEEKAKPLINVFVYGPVNAFDDFSQSGFAGHGRRDSFGAVSLDDGQTWKVTNLSNSAEKSSFELEDPIPDPGEIATIDTAFTVDDPDGVAITVAEWTDVNTTFGRLEVAGDADSRDLVVIRNAVTLEPLFRDRADRDGDFEQTRSVPVPDAPCWVQAGVDGVFGPVTQVANTPEECNGEAVPAVPEITAYPGDVNNVFHSTAGNKVIVAWQSKFCQAGFPGFALDDETKDTLATYLEIDNTVDLYLQDLFVVGGSQQSVDYRDQEDFDGQYADVAEVPYNCLWSARGILREDPEALGTTELVWLQAERLTSGRRDVNRIETQCVAGAGCAVTWQEDPEGLRPGEGEGPGTGWAGSTTASKTDIWYSFIEWEDFDIVDVNGELVPLADNIMDSGRPTPAVPMMVPVRLTNNDRCSFPVVGDETYCEEEFAGPLWY